VSVGFDAGRYEPAHSEVRTMSRPSSRSFILAALVVMAVASPLHAEPQAAQAALPQVVVLATGGTIAGAAASDVQATYTSGQVGVEQLLAAVPQAKKLAALKGEQISNIGSQDMNDEVWLKLAKRISELTAMPDVAGVVITHGTDTIEETAYFLNLVVKSRKPVVLTAAMRPSTALSADGPLNFYNAVAAAANTEASGRGVLVVVNDWIHGASSLTKTSTTAVQTFLSPLWGLIGTVAYGEVEFFRGPVGRNTVDSEFSLDGVTALPRVDIIMAHENMDGALIDAAAASGAKGIVIAGVGNGNMTAGALEALAAQAKKGVVCVRSTRVATGRVGQVLALHAMQVALFGGSGRVRDRGALESAVARPQMTFGGDDLYPDLAAKAAALLHSLVQNHPFVDGNKRTGAHTLVVFLLVNDCEPEFTAAELTEMTLVVARGELAAEAVAIWVRQRSSRRES
jgi:L-asparaginase